MATVNVTVNGKTIVCTPDTVRVTKSDNNLVTFMLGSEGYSFPVANAIVMKTPTPIDFPKPAITTKPTVVELIDLNKVAGLFPYSVKVVDGAGNVLELDPTIGNDGGG